LRRASRGSSVNWGVAPALSARHDRRGGVDEPELLGGQVEHPEMV
jgi:hypothetical protein